jgi:hypothetical protein
MRVLTELYLARRSRFPMSASPSLGRAEAIEELKTWVKGPLARRGTKEDWLKTIAAVVDKPSAFDEH